MEGLGLEDLLRKNNVVGKEQKARANITTSSESERNGSMRLHMGNNSVDFFVPYVGVVEAELTHVGMEGTTYMDCIPLAAKINKSTKGLALDSNGGLGEEGKSSEGTAMEGNTIGKPMRKWKK
jgi:hypothetical protein